MLESFSNIVKVQELRKKLIVTGLLLVVFRFGCYLPIPGIDVPKIQERFAEAQQDTTSAMGKMLSLADMFTGGSMRMGGILSLGIMPYITASIVFQLLTGLVPALERLQREGPTGRKKITQYTRVSTVFLCLFQASLICAYLLNQRAESAEGSFLAPLAVMSNAAFYFYGVVALTTGAIFLMWLGEQIDEFGIGNGISIIIMIGIVARLPYALNLIREDMSLGGIGDTGSINLAMIAVLVVLFVGMVLAIVLITLGQRRVPVHQAKATRGRRVYGGQRSFLPLRVNQSGVIPIIFAQAILMLPQWIMQLLGPRAQSYFRYGGYWYELTYVLLIIFFCYFYTAVTFNPNEMADNLKQNGSYIPGIRPGRRTAEHLESIMTRIALAGAIFLSFVAVMPAVITGAMSIRYEISAFFGGTGLLIVVGVALDVVQRVESYLLMKHYDGFVKGGSPIRGRRY
ncbi:MAG: preprotein translocase subunit SecY [Planctomycetota bacterium]